MNKKIICCFLGILIGICFLLVSCALAKKENIKNVHQQLVKVSDLKINKINSYFSIINNEIKELADSEETKYLLDQELVSSEQIAKINVDERSRIVLKKIENYVKKNQNKTFDELENDPVFQKNTVQEVDSGNFIAVENYQKQLSAFNEDGKFIGTKYENIKNNSPELYKIITEGIKNNQDIYGFFDWKEVNKKTVKKYLRITKLETKTGDGVTLLLIVMTNTDSYKMIPEMADLNTNYFEKNINKKDFNDLFLINPDGYIIYTNDIKKHPGVNLNWFLNQDSFLAKIFFETKDKNKIIFSDAYFNSYDELYPEFLVSSPVYDQNKLLGYVVLSKKMKTIFEITEDVENLGKTGESYLVNQDQKILISPLRDNHFDTFVQNIKTENVNNCFSGIKNQPTDILLNYNNERTVATNSLVSGWPWCLIIEIKENEILNISFSKECFISIIIFLFFSLTGFLTTIKKRKEIVKKEKILKIENFLIKLKIRYIILFSLIFTISYFFLATSFFQGWKKADLYNDLPDLFAVATLIMLFFYGFKFKDILAKKLILLGSCLTALDKLIQIIIEEYNYNFGVISTYFWLPGAITGFIGLFLIFYGFKKEIKLK